MTVDVDGPLVLGEAGEDCLPECCCMSRFVNARPEDDRGCGGAIGDIDESDLSVIVDREVCGTAEFVAQGAQHGSDPWESLLRGRTLLL